MNKLSINGGKIQIPPVLITYEALEDFSPGERWSVIGGNGSGKSTLAKAISGVIPNVVKGSVEMSGEVNGLPLFQGETYGSHLPVRVLPQNTNEFFLGLQIFEEWSVCCISNSPLDEQVRKYIHEECQLSEFSLRLPRELSDGEKQRVAIACFLSQGIPWMILDEWVSHLDFYWRSKLDGIISTFVKDTGYSTIELMISSTPRVAGKQTLKTSVITEERQSLRKLSLNTRIDSLHQLLQSYFEQSGKFYEHFPEVRLFHSGKLRFGGKKRTVCPIDVSRGELVLLLGRNGSGKTTILRETRVHSEVRTRKIRPVLVLTDPKLQIFGENIGSIVSKCLYNYSPNVQNMISELVLNVLDISAEHDPLELNFGCIKLFSVILGILNDSPVLMVDEPFTGLDEELSILATNALSFAKEKLNKAILITSANPSYVELLSDSISRTVSID